MVLYIVEVVISAAAISIIVVFVVVVTVDVVSTFPRMSVSYWLWVDVGLV